MPKVLKSYGTSGAVVTNLCPGIDRDINSTEPVFIRFDELPVPFFLESFEPKGNRSIVKFEDIDSLEAAENLVGREIYLTMDAEDESEEDGITGRTIIDASTGKEVGTVKELLDYSGNTCIDVELPGGDIITLPLHEDLIKKVNRKGIWLSIPEGLL